MSDYTPTTEEVRAQWGYNYPDYDNTSEQFDRWLTDVKAEAWQQGYTAGKPYPQLISKNPYWQGETK